MHPQLSSIVVNNKKWYYEGTYKFMGVVWARLWTTKTTMQYKIESKYQARLSFARLEPILLFREMMYAALISALETLFPSKMPCLCKRRAELCTVTQALRRQ